MALTVTHGPGRNETEGVVGDSIWDLGNTVLYQLCKHHPQHVAPQEIVAKVWLIGRSYAASVERGRSDGSASNIFYQRVLVPAIRECDLDSRLDEIGPAQELETIQDVRVVLAVHERLGRTVHSLSQRTGRSFASKYLHFHRPLYFPLFDSRSDRRIRKMVTGRLEKDFPKGDSQYRGFLARFLVLGEWIEAERELRVTPRQMDRLLLEY